MTRQHHAAVPTSETPGADCKDVRDLYHPLNSCGAHPLSSERSDSRDSSGPRSWFRQLDLAPFDLFIWPHPLVNQLPDPGRSEALRRP